MKTPFCIARNGIILVETMYATTNALYRYKFHYTGTKGLLLEIQSLHEYNIAHGDLKRENVIFNSKDIVKMIAVGYDKEKCIGNDHDKLRTFSYATSEMLRREKYDTHSADVWVLRIVCVP
jgi:serine/threonine protein kinase